MRVTLVEKLDCDIAGVVLLGNAVAVLDEQIRDNFRAPFARVAEVCAGFSVSFLETFDNIGGVEIVCELCPERIPDNTC